MDNKSKSIQKVIPEQLMIMLKDWIPSDSSVAIALNDTYIYFSSGHHNIHLEVGRQVQPGSIAAQVLSSNKRTDAILDNSLFDTPYYGIGYPIHIQDSPAALIVVLPSTFSSKS